MSFCFYQTKYTKLQMSLHYIFNVGLRSVTGMGESIHRPTITKWKDMHYIIRLQLATDRFKCDSACVL